MALSIRGSAAPGSPTAADAPAANPIAVGNLTTAAGSGLPLPRSELILAGKSVVRSMRRVTGGADPSGYSAAEIAQLRGDAARIHALASILAPSAGLASLADSADGSDAADASAADADSPVEIVERLRRNFGQLGYLQGVLDENVSQLDGQLAGLDGLPDGAVPADVPEFPADPAALSDEDLRSGRSAWAVRADVDFDALIRAQQEMNDLDDRRRNLDHQVDALSDLLARLDEAGTTLVPSHLGDTLCYGLGWHLAGDSTRMCGSLREIRADAGASARPAPIATPPSWGSPASATPAPVRPKGTPFAEWAAANKFEGGRLAILQALAGLQRWCGFYDALTGTVQRQLVQLRALADTASAARRLLSAELQRRALGTGEEPAPTA